MQETEAAVEETSESSSFMIHFHPDALIYKVDKDLISALIQRGAFQGLQDGRERELGQASIIGFKIHHNNDVTEAHEMEHIAKTVAQSESESETRTIVQDKGEAKESVPLSVWSRLPAACVAASAAAFLMGLVAVRLASRCHGRCTDYEQLGREAAAITA